MSRTIAAATTTELVERKSRFLALVHPVGSVDDVDAVIRSVRAAHPDARHHCTALVLGESVGGVAPLHRSSDDGEPSGTAGVPMLQTLLHNDLVDTLAVVTRYFGGVKLGAGGLVRAYTASVQQAIEEATLLRRIELVEAGLEIPIADIGLAEHAVRLWADAHGAQVEPTSYGGSAATMTVLVEPDVLPDLRADTARWSSGAVDVEDVGRRTADVI